MLHSCRAKTSYLYISPSLHLFMGFYKHLTDEKHFKQLVTDPLFVKDLRLTMILIYILWSTYRNIISFVLDLFNQFWVRFLLIS